MLQDLLTPVYVIGGLGFCFGLALAYSSKKFDVNVNERITLIREVLPGANCGGCGMSGCDSYAEALDEGKCSIDLCPVGGATMTKKLSEIMGVSTKNPEVKVARVMCTGDNVKSLEKFQYNGINDCAAVTNFFGGQKKCGFACVGMGNCKRECPFDAIVIENGVSRIIQSKCKACGKCIEACPKKVIKMVPIKNRYSVKCSSLDKGNIIAKNCKVGCIGCGKCKKVCTFNAITIDSNLAKIDYNLCENCGECEKVCPTNTITGILNFSVEISNIRHQTKN